MTLFFKKNSDFRRLKYDNYSTAFWMSKNFQPLKIHFIKSAKAIVAASFWKSNENSYGILKE